MSLGEQLAALEKPASVSAVPKESGGLEAVYVGDHHQLRQLQGPLGMSAAAALKFTFPRISASLQHYVLTTAWTKLLPRYPLLTGPEEFIEGASDAYKYFLNESTAAESLGHLEPLCSPELYSIALDERARDTSNTAQVRQLHGSECALDMHHLEAYVTALSLPGQCLDHLNIPNETARLSAGVKFLSESQFRCNMVHPDVTYEYRNDWVLFSAPHDDETGLGQFKIMDVQ